MHLWLLAILAVCVRVLYAIVAAAISPTRNIPGPFLARFTRLWYLHSVWTGQHQKHAIALHRKYAKGQYYAPIVRLAPNLFSIIEPDKQIYGVSSKMEKGDWYEGWKHPSPDRWTLFPDRNIKRHNDTRKKFQALYSLSSLVSYEGYVDDCTTIFMDRLKEITKSGESVDMGHWFLCYAFDVIGDITYGKRYGFLDEGRDVNGVMKSLDASMLYSTLAGIYSWLHPYMYAVMQKIPGSGAAGRTYLMNFVSTNMANREAERKNRDDAEKGIERGEGMPEDFLDKLLDLRDDQKKGVTDYHCFMMGLSNIIAGADTTALSLSAILYYLIRTPRAMNKLRAEIKDKTETGACEEDRVAFKDGQNMPYLQACLKEAMRMHAGTGLPLWRRVNEGGIELDGTYLPAGSDVGVNPWVLHYNRDVWGPDVNEYRPERWIEAEEAGGDELKTLDAHWAAVRFRVVYCFEFYANRCFVVRVRIANVYREAYLISRDNEARAADCAQLRFRVEAC